MVEHEMHEEVTADAPSDLQYVDPAGKIIDPPTVNIGREELSALYTERDQLKRTVAELKVVLMQLQAQLNQTQAQLINIEFQKAQAELQALGPAQPANTHLMP